MIRILFSAPAPLWPEYEPHLLRALQDKGIAADLSPGCDTPSAVDYIVYAPNGPAISFPEFTRLKAVLGLWAGAETTVGNTTITVPLTRMVDPGLTEGMVEWVTGHVLRHHLGMDAHIINPDHAWHQVSAPLARQRIVTVLGAGELGGAVAKSLAALNFNTRAWGRRDPDIAGVTGFSGRSGLASALDGAHIVVLLLPLTAATENVINAETLACLAPGAFLINPGRGPLIDDTALIAALASGQLAHATLDVFRTEPLPADHPFWEHPAITVTPHIAADTRAATAAPVIAENIRRSEAGEPLLHLVDRKAGY